MPTRFPVGSFYPEIAVTKASRNEEGHKRNPGGEKDALDTVRAAVHESDEGSSDRATKDIVALCEVVLDPRQSFSYRPNQCEDMKDNDDCDLLTI